MRRNRYESHVFRLEPVERCPMQCMYGGGEGDRVTMTPTALVACNAMPQPLKWKRHLSREESSPLTGALERMVLVAIQRRTMRFIYYNSSGAVETILVICQRLWYIKFYWCICDVYSASVSDCGVSSGATTAGGRRRSQWRFISGLWLMLLVYFIYWSQAFIDFQLVQ